MAGSAVGSASASSSASASREAASGAAAPEVIVLVGRTVVRQRCSVGNGAEGAAAATGGILTNDALRLPLCALFLPHARECPSVGADVCALVRIRRRAVRAQHALKLHLRLRNHGVVGNDDSLARCDSNGLGAAPTLLRLAHRLHLLVEAFLLCRPRVGNQAAQAAAEALTAAHDAGECGAAVMAAACCGRGGCCGCVWVGGGERDCVLVVAVVDGDGIGKIEGDGGAAEEGGRGEDGWGCGREGRESRGRGGGWGGGISERSAFGGCKEGGEKGARAWGLRGAGVFVVLLW